MATIVRWLNMSTGQMLAAFAPPEDCIHVHGTTVDGPDSKGVTTVTIDWTRVDGSRLSWAAPNPRAKVHFAEVD